MDRRGFLGMVVGVPIAGLVGAGVMKPAPMMHEFFKVDYTAYLPEWEQNPMVELLERRMENTRAVMRERIELDG